MKEVGDPRMHTVPELPWKQPVAHLIALQLMHHKPTGNDAADALLYRSVYKQMRRWLVYLETEE